MSLDASALVGKEIASIDLSLQSMIYVKFTDRTSIEITSYTYGYLNGDEHVGLEVWLGGQQVTGSVYAPS